MGFGRRAAGAAVRIACLGLLAGLNPGCAMMNSFFDPTTVGSFPAKFQERGIKRALTPRDTPPGLASATEPTPEDLVPDNEDYRITAGDQLAVVIEDLLTPGLQDNSVLEVSPTGYIRLPVLGTLRVVGLTEAELEQEIKTLLKENKISPNPIVRVFVQLKRNRYFTIIGSVGAAGPYGINDPDTRLLDAIGLARDIDATIRKLYVIRRVDKKRNGNGGNGRKSLPAEPTRLAPPSDEKLIIPPPAEPDDSSPASFFANVGYSQPAVAQDKTERDELESAIGPDKPRPQPNIRPGSNKPLAPQVYEPPGGQLEPPPVEPARVPEPEKSLPTPLTPTDKQDFDWEAGPDLELAQRVIEIDTHALRNGDPRYNIVVRNRDVIYVPTDTGVFYMMGEINRPGVFAFGGREITIKQAISIAGGFSELAWPERCEIIRREPGTDKQITISVNLDKVFAGLADDFLLRDDDIVNVGTHTIAPFLFVIRNSFRFTYGFGFVYDRNFADKDTYGNRLNPEVAEQAKRQSRGLPF
jgi:protein involved in polysaccharide export with SLBB domain